MAELVLVTGSTGYVATRLIPALLSRGYRLRCLARSPEKLRNRLWLEQVELVKGDVLDIDSLHSAMKGVDYAYYLVHNMSSGESYREKESTGARNFGEAAHNAEIKKIIYLGGLGGSAENRHMRSRQEAGRLLRSSGVPVTEFRASVVIGSGSISFEMIRFFTGWSPFIPAPVQNDFPSQPVGIKDLLGCLVSSLESDETSGKILEIGGTDIFPYPDLLVKYARLVGMTRPRINLPFTSTSIGARLADWLTPVPHSIAFPLMEELQAASVVTDVESQSYLSMIGHLSSYEESVEYALAREEYPVNLPWTALLVTRAPLIGKRVRTCGEGLLIDHREETLESISRAGVALLEGRVDQTWEVESNQPGEWIRLKRRGSLPGILRCEIQFRKSILMHTIVFEPNGLPGMLWWYFLYPFYYWRFDRMFEKLIG